LGQWFGRAFPFDFELYLRPWRTRTSTERSVGATGAINFRAGQKTTCPASKLVEHFLSLALTRHECDLREVRAGGEREEVYEGKVRMVFLSEHSDLFIASG
jgi:hypothetical protein